MATTLNTGGGDPAPEENGLSDHDKAMIEKAEKAQQTPEENQETPQEQPKDADTRPEWLPEKFKTAEDMAKAYAALEQKLGAPKDAPKSDDDKTEEAVKDAEKALEAKGLDVATYEKEFLENGTLGDESYATLEKAGISRDMVDAYIEGQQARAERVTQSFYEAAGGQETYGAMTSWAREKWSPDEIVAFNETIQTGTEAQAKVAILGLKAAYTEAEGSPPKRTLSGGTNTAATSDVFRSNAELTKAMSDPRYAKDPAYRKDVEEKLARSSIF